MANNKNWCFTTLIIAKNWNIKPKRSPRRPKQLNENSMKQNPKDPWKLHWQSNFCLIGNQSNIDCVVVSSHWRANPHPHTFIKFASIDKTFPLATYLVVLIRSRAKKQNAVPNVSTIIHHFQGCGRPVQNLLTSTFIF